MTQHSGLRQNQWAGYDNKNYRRSCRTRQRDSVGSVALPQFNPLIITIYGQEKSS